MLAMCLKTSPKLFTYTFIYEIPDHPEGQKDDDDGDDGDYHGDDHDDACYCYCPVL